MYTYLVRRKPGSPEAGVGGMYHCDDHSTLGVAARPRVGLLSFCHKMDGYAFKRSLRLHDEAAIHQHDKLGEVTTLPEAGLQILILLLIRCHMETLLR